MSIDEAFLDLSGTERLHGHSAAMSLATLARDIEREIGITVSIGLSYNKFLAKVASDLEKPRGFSVIGKAEAPAFLARQKVSLIWGVGKATQERSGACRHHRHRAIADARENLADARIRLDRRQALSSVARRRCTPCRAR